MVKSDVNEDFYHESITFSIFSCDGMVNKTILTYQGDDFFVLIW